MEVYKCNRRDTRVAPWTALCLLSLIAAMVFASPSVVSAQNVESVEFSQDCETAMVGDLHQIRVKVTGVPVGWADRFTRFGFWIRGNGPNAGAPPAELFEPDANGEFVYEYTSTGVGTDQLELVDAWFLDVRDVNGQKAVAFTTWTDKAEELCADSSSPPLVIGGWEKLKDRKWGGVTIAICGAGCTDSFNVYDVDRDSVRMAGVSPRRAVYRDSRLCPDGKDAYVDLVLRFKRREVLKALEESLGGELVDGEPVTLDVTGILNDETVINGKWEPMIKKIKKRRKWRR